MDHWGHHIKRIAVLSLIQALSVWLINLSEVNTVEINSVCVNASEASTLRISPGNYDPDYLIPHSCSKLCARSRASFAGVTNAKICLCGNAIQQYSAPTCGQPCTGNPSLFCGGQTEFNVYNLSTLLQNEPQLQFESKPVVFESASFQVNLVNDTSAGYHVTHEYTAFLNEATPRLFGNKYNYTFTTWGNDVQLLVIPVENLWQEFKETIDVDVPFEFPTLKCPSYTLVGETFECVGRLDLGNGFNMTWTFLGNSSSIALSDPTSSSVGPPVPRWTITDGGKDLANGLVRSLSHGVTLPVIILGWEMNVNRSGTVEVVVMRPDCGSGLAYCPLNNNCCPLNSKFSSELCNQENTFCGSSGVCVNPKPEATCELNKTSSKTTLSNMTYNVVYNITLNVQRGYNLKLLPADGRFEYLPGDVLGWTKTYTSATFSLDPQKGHFMIENEENTGTFLLTGIASMASDFLLDMTSPNSPAIDNITVYYQTSKGESRSTTHSVHALNAIGNVSFVTNSPPIGNNSCVIYGPLNEPFNITLHIAGGTMKQVLWSVENKSTESNPNLFGDQEEINLQQNFTFARLGRYFLAVMVTNPVSGRIIHADVVIQERITGLHAAFRNNKIVYQGIKKDLILSVATGSNITFKLHFGDGSPPEVLSQNDIGHIYRTLGLVNTTIEATNMVSSENFTLLVEVLNPVEIILPSYGVNGSKVNMTCKLPDSFTDDYWVVLEIGDSAMMSSNCNTIEHTFATGSHNIRCSIHLSVVVSANETLYVLEPINGLNIHALPPIKFGEQALVQANITSGNNVSYLWTASGLSSTTNLTSATMMNFTRLGEVKLSVNASNAISMQYAEIIVIVQEPVGDLTVNPSSNPGASNMNIKFNIIKTSGTYVNYTVDIAGTPIDLGTSSNFTYSFPEGVHDIAVRAKNFVSQSNMTYQMFVQDPLINPLNISCPTDILVDGVCHVKSNEQLVFEAVVSYATNVTFTWSMGSQGVPVVAKPYVKSSSTVTFNSSEGYNISVVAQNNISSSGNWLWVYVLDKIEGFSFRLSPGVVAVNETLSVSMFISTGSNVTFSFDAGDPKVTPADTGLTTTHWKYTGPGIFLVKGIAKNSISNATYALSVAVQEKVSSIRFTNSPIADHETSHEVTIRWKINGGTNVSTEISWGDGNKEVMSFTLCTYSHSPISFTCEKRHAFNEAGSYKILLTAYNLLTTRKNVSEDVSIKDPISNLTVSISPQKAFTNKEISIKAEISTGTDVLYEFYLGDNRNITSRDKTITAKYYEPGDYTVKVIARNGIDVKESTEFPINIDRAPKEVKIKGLVLSTKATALGDTTSLEVTYEAGAIFKCIMDYGDGKTEEIEEDVVYKPILHQYIKPDAYRPTITCYNGLGSEKATTLVLVHEKITQLALKYLDMDQFPSENKISLSWTNGSHVTIVAREKGKQIACALPSLQSRSGYVMFPSRCISTPGYHEVHIIASNAVSSIQMTAKFSLIERIVNPKVLVNPYVSTDYPLIAYVSVEKGSDYQVTWSFGDGGENTTTNCTWKETCSKRHTYKKIGRYDIKAYVTNAISRAFASEPVEILYPIFGWEFNSLNISEVNNPSYMLLRYNNSYPFPTNATYEITYKDEGGWMPITDVKPLTGNDSIIVAFTFNTSGCFEAKVVMKSKVSTVVKEATIEVRGKIDTPAVTVKSLRSSTSPSETLPIEYPVEFTSDIKSNCLKYNWTVSDHGGRIVNVSDKEKFEYTFNSPGEYHVNFTAFDDRMSRTAAKTVRVDKSVTGLYFSSDGIAQINDTIHFVILCASLGDSTSFEVDYGDTTSVKLTELRTITEDFRANYNLDVPFNPKGFYGVIFNHTYTNNGTYTATVHTRNSTSSPSLSNEVVIARKACPLPDIEILGANLDFEKAPEIPYEVQYTLFSKVQTKCTDKIKIAFTWTVYRADVFLLRLKGSSLPPQEELRYDLSSGIRTNQSSLTIPRKGLKPGLYILQLSASFPDVKANTKYIVYLKIKRPPLKVLIAGGSSRSVAWDKEFRLDASSSIDPVTQSTVGLSYEWTCKKKGNIESGGCFGYGEELSEFTDNAVATFRPKILVETTVYQFTVTISTTNWGKTQESYTQEVQAIPGNPPESTLRCVSNCAPYKNPESRVSLVSECHGDCDNAKYEWNLENTDSSMTTQDIWPNRTLTPINSPNLVVKAGTFQPKKTYTFKLKVTNQRGKTGFASYEVKTNSPPHGGNCSFTPSNGTALKTEFKFSCENWKDDQKDSDQPLSYKVFYFSPDKPELTFLLHHGPQSSLDKIKLPAANGEDRIFNISVRVEDVYRAYAENKFSIKVEPAGGSDNLATFKNMSSLVDELVGSGDIQSANRLAVAVLSETSKGEENGTDEKATILNNIVTGLTDNLPEDLDSMRQTVETLGVAVDSDADVVGQEVQGKAVNAFLKTADKLKSEAKEDIGNDVVEDIAVGLLSGISNALRVSSTVGSKFRGEEDDNTTLTEEDQGNLNNTRETAEKALGAISAVTGSILEKKVRDEGPVTIGTKNMEASVWRAGSGQVNGSSVKFKSNCSSSFSLPSNVNVGQEKDGAIDLVSLSLSSNPHSSYNTSKLVDSRSVSLELKQTNGSAIEVKNLPEPIRILIPLTGSKPDEVPINKTQTKESHLNVHVVKLSSPNNAFFVEITPDIDDANITLYIRNGTAPTPTVFKERKTFVLEKIRRNDSYETISYFVDNALGNDTKFFVGVQTDVKGKTVAVNYTFKSLEVGCYFWSEERKIWTTDGCTPGNRSTANITECLCNHATMFGSNFFVTPNVIDIEKEILNLANLGKYPALLATICIILGTYIIAMVWAKRKDRMEIGKESLHVAIDNEPGDSQRYEVILSTGSRRNAGSTAEVSLIITGDNGDSEPRCLQRTSPLSLHRSSQDSYIVTTANPLGPLQYIRIWHDNSGDNPSWFLTEVIIRDVETGQQYIFLCNNWLACDEGDGLVERLLPVSSPEELKDFQYLFMQNSSKGFSDGHLWFSIILRPPQNRFTHAQRVSCCLCLLLCTMLANAMFFQVDVSKENNVDVDMGPYQFSWHEIMVGIQSSLIVFPVNLLIVTMFRHIGIRPKKSSRYLADDGASANKSSKVGVSLRDIELEKNRRNEQKLNKTAKQSEPPEVTTSSGRKKMWFLPWWCVYIAWLVLIAVSLTAGFFTLLYGISFEKTKQEKWLTALFISVFQDVLISQPIKIFALSLFIAFVIRKPNPVEVNEENEKLAKDENWIQESLSKANPEGIVKTKPERRPPDELILKKMRLARQKERKMFEVIREVLQHFFFWWIIIMIAYGYREPDAHLLTTSMENTFVELGQENDNFSFKSNGKEDLYKTKNKRDVLMWVNEVIIPGLDHASWYNNRTDRQKSIISDGVGYLVGSARLRTLRIKKDTCKVAKLISGIIDGCESEYSFSNEYQIKYNRKNWIPSNGTTSDRETQNIWRYRSQAELYERPFWADHATYRGGGYVLELKKGKFEAQKQIEELDKTWWIDGETRAVFVEFTIFSPNKNLHSIVTIVFECTASGGCSAGYQILTTRVDELVGNYRIFVVFCELIFVIYLVHATYNTFKEMLKEGYKFWRGFWNWVEMAIVSVGWSCLAFYILRFIANKWTKHKFHEERGRFVSFRYLATADQLYGIVLAFVVFLVSLKFLRLFRFNRRMSLLGSTLKFAAWDLVNFFFMFVIAFIACASVSYLLFNNDIDMFSSFLVTTQTLINIILGKFKYMNLSHDTFVSSFVVIVVYVVTVVFVLMNVFLAILNDAFQAVKADNDLQENEYEIVDYITARFKSWIGIRTKRPEGRSDFEHEYGFRPTYVRPQNKKYQVPVTVHLDRKIQDLLDFVERQVDQDKLEDSSLNELTDADSRKKALLLLLS